MQSIKTALSSLAMPAAILHRNEISAVATVLLAIAVAVVIDRALAKRELSAVADTRVRLLRRLVFVGIFVIGLALGLMQFDSVKRAATGVLASSAVLGLVVGFAARQTLANAIAGILLAITQPIRIGDLVKFEGESGVVEDVRLTYTYLRAEDNRRIIVPNERLAASTIENFTIVDPRIEVEVTIGLPLETDPNRAIETLSEMDDTHVEVSAVEKDGYELLVRSHAGRPLDRREVAARIRAACVERLRRENILG